ncbi:MAG: hypothetical protein HY520_00830, partial [Candidatus Aenigmarchaeota archaeon]|nr:hypothetical protein [Candidatus Aenigmarchaeota archaeon]
ALAEVRRSLEEALRDPRGLLARQRLLMAALSLGMQHLIELWLHKSGAIKPGDAVKHEWLAAEEKRLRLRLAGALTKQLQAIRGADAILALAREVERDRNDIIYGAPLRSDAVLREKIEAFMELKKAVERAVGEAVW